MVEVHGSKPAMRAWRRIYGCRLAPSAGMTLLEVLVAILLFAIFSATLLMVSEVVRALIPGEVLPQDDNSCNGLVLESACINVAFDAIVPVLERTDPKALDISGSYRSPNSVPAVQAAKLQFGWPDAYILQIVAYPELKQTDTTSMTSPSRPGLYLLQATPRQDITPSLWRKPVQRLFCRPYHRCIQP